MLKYTYRITSTLLFFFFLGCSHQHLQVPKTHPLPDQNTQPQVIQPEPTQSQLIQSQLTQSQLIHALPPNLSKKRQTIVHAAIENIGRPYTWGGQSPGSGFDCSGLVFFTHEKAGLRVPRTTKDQFQKGRPISKQALVPGDLVFFDIPEKKAGLHVGIFIGKRQFIHAPGRGRQVRIANLNNSYFTQNFKGARSYL
jgi:cell wall-associated NlpC family hydrolase